MIEPVTRHYRATHEPLSFTFKSMPNTFYVDEILDFTPSGRGSTLLVEIEKTFTSTWELLDHIQETLGASEEVLGFAGLKDKYATTTQYISMPKMYASQLKYLETKNIHIKNTFLHHEGLKIGGLKGNHFKMVLQSVTPIMAGKIQKIFGQLGAVGMPNYFGAQRFGTLEGNLDDAYELIFGEKHLSNKRLAHMLVASYQAHMFNSLLAHRLTAQNPDEIFEILEGDVCLDLTTHKFFTVTNTQKAQKDFHSKVIMPTGLMPGKKVWRAQGKAYEIEKHYDVEEIYEKGFRRAVWVYPQENNFSYDIKNQTATIGFWLPKSSYATILIENLKLTPPQNSESKV